MKCQILFKGQNKTNVTNSSTAELAEGVVRIKISSKINLIERFEQQNKTVSAQTCTFV